MAVHRLKTPISEAETRTLKVNDTLFITGTIVTARDQAHKRALEYAAKSESLPVKLEGLAIYHCGPIMRKEGEKWVAVATGPTTSARMESAEPKFIEHFKPRIIIGKGGMSDKTTQAMSKFGAVYGAFTGGAAVLAASAIKNVKDVVWLDLGMPEAMWILEVEDFGPLVVAIDSLGNNLYLDVMEKVEQKKSAIYGSLRL